MNANEQLPETYPPGATPGGAREMLAIALPMVASNACDTVMHFTDRLFLSRVGPENMNAAMGGGLTVFTLMSFFIGLCGFSTALVAQHYGANQRNRCAAVLTQAAIVSVVAYPLILLAKPLAILAFERSGLAAPQLAAQKVYFGILVYVSVAALLRASLSGFFSGIGRTRIVMASAITTMSVNIAMNYILIFGKLGSPALGIRGAAYGTVIGSVAGLLVLLGAYLRPANAKAYGVMRSLRFDWVLMKRLLKFGVPVGFDLVVTMLAFNTLIMTFHADGLVTATAVTIMYNWDMVSFIPLIGVQIGVMSLMGRYMGARRPDIAHKTVMSGLKMAWCYSGMILILFVTLARPLAMVFRPSNVDEAVYEQALPTAIYMIRLAAIYVMTDSLMVVFAGALRGAGDTLWAMCISAGLHWMMPAVVFVTLHVLELSPETTWTIMVIAFACLSTLFYLRYRTGKWREIDVIHTPAAMIAMEHEHDLHGSTEL